MDNNLKHRLFSLILIITVVVTYMPIGMWTSADSAYAASAWDGSISDDAPPMDEEGTTYLIGSGEELAWFANEVNSGNNGINAKLTACIDLGNNEWTPIGGDGNSFTGTFDGDGHTISGLSMTACDNSENMGFFSSLSGGAVVKNLTVSGSLTGDADAYAAGGLVASIESYTSGEDILIQNCAVDVDINLPNAYAAGGVVGCDYGDSYSLTIERCANHGDISALDYSEAVGGLYGFCTQGMYIYMADCYNDGSISGSSYTGGLIGWNNGEITINRVGSFGSVISSSEMGASFLACFDSEPTYENLWYSDEASDVPADSIGGVIAETFYIGEYGDEEFLEAMGDSWTISSDGNIMLAWEAENLSHTDAAPATKEEKEQALAALDTYKSKSNYYENERQQIQSIISTTKTDVMESDLTIEAVNGKIAAAKTQMDAVKQRSWVDAITSGLNQISELFSSLIKGDYDDADWQEIVSIKEKAEEDINKASESDIQGIATKAVQDINNIMTTEEKANFEASKVEAQQEIAEYIDACKAEFPKAVELAADNSYAAKKLAEAQQSIEEELKTYLPDGEEYAKVAGFTTKAELESWITDAKANIDAQKKKGVFTKISSAEEFLAFASYVNNTEQSVNAILTADIDLSDKTYVIPGSSSSKAYSGIFLGDGHTLTINISGDNVTHVVGAFGYVDGAVIDGLTVAGTIASKSTSTSGGTGGIAGYATANKTPSETVITNCVNKASVTGEQNTAGILGWIDGKNSDNPASLVIDNCRNTGSITMTRTGTRYTAGILASLGSDIKTGKDNGEYGIRIENCVNSGDVTSAGTADVQTAGILNTSSKVGTDVYLYIADCKNSGTIKAESGRGTHGTGGIVSVLNNSADIIRCGNEGTISANGYQGGIIGRARTQLSLTVQECYNKGAINVQKSGKSAGGIAGYAMSGSFSYLYNAGKVADAASDANYLGGIIGYFGGYYQAENCTLTKSYNTGTIEGNNDRLGSVIGWAGVYDNNDTTGADVAELSYCFGLEGTAEKMVGSLGLPKEDNPIPETWAYSKTEQEMKEQEFVSLLNGETEGSFVFDDTGVINGGYPVFQYLIDELLTSLEPAKDAAKADLQNKYSSDNYYATQAEQIKELLKQAFAAIDEIKDSVASVDITRATWENELNDILTGMQVNTRLAGEKSAAKATLDSYLDFSAYQEKPDESVLTELGTLVSTYKTRIDGVTGEAFSADFEAISDMLDEALPQIDDIYLNAGIWNGNAVPDEYAPAKDQDGTYLISNGVELAWFASYVNSSSGRTINARLIDDVDLGGKLWTPIGDSSSSFKGAFDGGGHKIYGLYADVSQNNYAGLFGYQGNGSKISDLQVYGNIQGTTTNTYETFAGGVAGYSLGEIAGCTSYVAINVEQGDKCPVDAGGIAGYGNVIMNCSNEGDIILVKENNTSTGTGGIAGKMTGSGALVLFCSNRGDIKGGYCTGGIVGLLGSSTYGGAKVRACYNEGDISATLYHTGGIVGYCSAAQELITNVYNTGNVAGRQMSGTSPSFGGIVGTMGPENTSAAVNEAAVTNAYNIGSMSSADSVEGGAIIGTFRKGTVSNTYTSTGNLFGIVADSMTNVTKSLVVTPEKLKGYADKLGDAFADDADSLNGGYPVLAFQQESEELIESKIAAIEELRTALVVSNYSQYGDQIQKLFKTVDEQQQNIENATTFEEVAAAKEKAVQAVGSVKTELEKAKSDAIDGLKLLAASSVYSEANEEYINTLLSTAESAINSCTTVAKVNELNAEYTQEIKIVPTYTADSITELNDYMNSLIGEDTGDAVKKQLAAIMAAAEADILEAKSRSEIDDIYYEARAEMYNAVENPVLDDLVTEEGDQLAEARKTAYKEVLDSVSAGLADDYRPVQWQEINEALGDAADNILAAADETEINSARDQAIEVIKSIPTKAQLEEEEAELKSVKDSVTEALKYMLEEINILGAEQRETAQKLINQAMEDIEDTSLDQLSLDEAVEAINDIYDGVDATVKAMIEAVKEEDWSADVAAPSSDAQGVYQISSAQELAWFAQEVNSGNNEINAVLTADIDLAGKSWIPIGYTENDYQSSMDSVLSTLGYRGIFDGQGYTVSNMFVEATAGTNGLFGVVNIGGKVENLTISGMVVSSGNASGTKQVRAGSVAGLLINGSIINCTSKVLMTSTIDNGIDENGATLLLTLGGIVGSANKGTIEKCINKGNMSTKFCTAAGGILGYRISQYSSSSSVLQITECANLADITYSSDTTGATSAGGIIGDAQGKANVSNCYNAGLIKANKNAGGIIGSVGATYASELTVSSCYNKGAVQSPADAYAGGIIGRAEAGVYEEELYVLEGSADHTIGWIIASNMIDFVDEDTLKGDEMPAKLGGSFIQSIAGVNDGCPIFSWQLTDSDIKAEISGVVENHLVKDDFTDQQWSRAAVTVESGKNAVLSAETPESVISAYNEAITDLDGLPVLFKEEFATSLDRTSTLEYDSALAQSVRALIEEKKTEITGAEVTPKEAQSIYDATRAQIATLAIRAIGDDITADSRAAISAARNTYDALTDVQKAQVNAMKLYSAEQTYERNSEAASKAEKLIYAIGDVTDKSKPVIDAARNAFDSLTEAQKTYLSQGAENILLQAEKAYADILATSKPAEDDNKPSGSGNAGTGEANNSGSYGSNKGVDSKDNGNSSGNTGISFTSNNRQTGQLFYQDNTSVGNSGGSEIGAENSIGNSTESSVADKIRDGESGVTIDKDGAAKLGGFDWSILFMGLGVIVLAAIGYVIIRWFGAAQKNKKK